MVSLERKTRYRLVWKGNNIESVDRRLGPLPPAWRSSHFRLWPGIVIDTLWVWSLSREKKIRKALMEFINLQMFIPIATLIPQWCTLPFSVSMGYHMPWTKTPLYLIFPCRRVPIASCIPFEFNGKVITIGLTEWRATNRNISCWLPRPAGRLPWMRKATWPVSHWSPQLLFLHVLGQ